ncbi:MAG: sodium-independent anion transporter [Chloroflexi bacterium]|nr:sodium-independent anion transporter [Chloroflexota bacterium]
MGILQGLILAVILSLLGLIAHAKNPTIAILGKVVDENAFHNLKNYPEAETYPGLLIFRFDEQLFFANAPNFRDAIRAALAADPSVRRVLIDAEAINDIDITGLDTLAELKDELAHSNIELCFARVKTQIREIIRRAGLEEQIGADRFYPTIQSGIDAYLAG